MHLGREGRAGRRRALRRGDRLGLVGRHPRPEGLLSRSRDRTAAPVGHAGRRRHHVSLQRRRRPAAAPTFARETGPGAGHVLADPRLPRRTRHQSLQRRRGRPERMHLGGQHGLRFPASDGITVPGASGPVGRAGRRRVHDHQRTRVLARRLRSLPLRHDERRNLRVRPRRSEQRPEPQACLLAPCRGRRTPGRDLR